LGLRGLQNYRSFANHEAPMGGVVGGLAGSCLSQAA